MSKTMIGISGVFCKLSSTDGFSSESNHVTFNRAAIAAVICLGKDRQFNKASGNSAIKTNEGCALVRLFDGSEYLVPEADSYQKIIRDLE